jgi:hypothetical protein
MGIVLLFSLTDDNLDNLIGGNSVSVIDLLIAASVWVENCTLRRLFIFKL